MTGLDVLLAGVGGQGVLFGGKVLAYAGMIEGKEISWLPAYGPEMRGGTANCSVCISDEPIGSPLVTAPDILVAMNLPSLDKFEDSVVPGGTIIVDSSIVGRRVARTDVNAVYVDASEMAERNGLRGMANMILVGRLFSVTGFCSAESLDLGIVKSVPARKADKLDLNRRAVSLGME